MDPFINLPVRKLELKNSSLFEVEALYGMTELRYLDVEGSMLRQLPELMGMDLDYVNISDTAMNDFRDLAKVKVKRLIATEIKAVNLINLAQNKHIIRLEIDAWRYKRPEERLFIADFLEKGVIHQSGD